MNKYMSYTRQDFQEVSTFLHFVKTNFHESLNTYPVIKLSEESEQIILEMAHDKDGKREILLTIYIDVYTTAYTGFGKFIGINEIMITITNHAQLIGLFNLIFIVLGSQVKSVYPIDKDGHFSPFKLDKPCCESIW